MDNLNNAEMPMGAFTNQLQLFRSMPSTISQATPFHQSLRVDVTPSVIDSHQSVISVGDILPQSLLSSIVTQGSMICGASPSADDSSMSKYPASVNNNVLASSLGSYPLSQPSIYFSQKNTEQCSMQSAFMSQARQREMNCLSNMNKSIISSPTYANGMLPAPGNRSAPQLESPKLMMNARKIMMSNTQKKMILNSARKKTPTVMPVALNNALTSENIYPTDDAPSVTGLTTVNPRHEMQPHHFQNTLTKARQTPVKHPTQNILPPTIPKTRESTTRTNGPIHNIVLASMMAAVNGKGTASLLIKNQTKKKRKRPKKPSLKLNRSADQLTMVPQLIDSSEKQFKCPDCPRKFSWHFQLQQHSRTHSGERPFVCSECQQAYKRREHLQRHERVHTGERPFECRDCGKKYRRRSQLIRHVRVHTGERPYNCTICSKAFRRRGHLCRHFKTHANEILKKSGINPTSLEEASALLTVAVPSIAQSVAKNPTPTSSSPHANHSQAPLRTQVASQHEQMKSYNSYRQTESKELDYKITSASVS